MTGGDRAGQGMVVPENHVIVLFGATGDLARRKLLPGLVHLAEAGLMPERYRIVAVAQEEMSHDAFRDFARGAVDEFARKEPSGDAWTAFAESLSYVPAGETSALVEAESRAQDDLGGGAPRLIYLSVPPIAVSQITSDLAAAGLGKRARVIFEKPFGSDEASARELNAAVHEVLEEDQVYRIDHFLGKEAVQNLLALRFANGMFEPVWNRNHVDHVQIDVPEDLSIGTRGAFYEPTGAFRDMVVTHLFQVMGFVAMEPPTSLEPRDLVDEKIKVFRSMVPLRPEDVVRGQYDGYRDADGVAADSDTETFVALKAYVDNWRWAGVPFYLRTGKQLAEGRRLLTIVFREPPRRMFPASCEAAAANAGPNQLVVDLGDPGGVTAKLMAKAPGPTMELTPVAMDFSFGDGAAEGELLEAYERLLHDALVGDRTLFTRADGIERLWQVSAPALDEPSPLCLYPPGSWGPEGAQRLIAPRRWNLS